MVPQNTWKEVRWLKENYLKCYRFYLGSWAHGKNNKTIKAL